MARPATEDADMIRELESQTRNFMEDYDKHIHTILSMPSGNHAPDPEKLSQWVTAQVSERRRNAARAIAENITYITHRDLIKSVNELIDDVNSKKIPDENIFILCAGPKNKSNYFISLLFYHFSKIKGFKLPDYISNILHAKHYKINDKRTTIYYVDDMSYSGSQIQQLLSSIYAFDEKNSPHWDIRICLPYASEAALLALQHVTYGKYGLPRTNPYKVYNKHTIPSLKKIIGEKQYWDCIAYFSYISNPDCVCYFDHKIADAPSTFLYVLLFGIVPPATINYKPIYTEQKIFKYEPLKHDLPEKEIIDDAKKDNKIDFIPFLKNCEYINEFIMKNKTYFESIPYHYFLANIKMYIENEYGAFNIILREMFGNNEYRNSNLLTIRHHDEKHQKMLNFFKERNSVSLRCPRSWYKNMFAGGKTKKHRRTKKYTYRARNRTKQVYY
jgi:hypothetical protein